MPFLYVEAQEGVQQRFFTSQNGLKISWVNSITHSQNSHFTIVHSPKFSFARYDGFSFTYSISPSGILGRTYEDCLGNLWSVDEENLDNVYFYSNDTWQNFEFDVGVPFMPTPGVGNKLLFIRDGVLKEYDREIQKTRIVKLAEESLIGQFIDMTTFQDGSLWITGEYGVAKYMPQSEDSKEQWIDFQVPKSLGLYHFSKPFEGANGELTFISKFSGSKHKVLAGFDEKKWQILYVSKTDEVYYGWRGHNKSLWIIKGIKPPSPLNTTLKNWDLYHIQDDKETRIIKNRVLNRVLNDIVVEPNGAFWLATGSGLAHFTPTLWRTKTREMNGVRVKKIHEDLRGRLWFAAEDSFFMWSNNKWESFQFKPIVFTGDVCSLNNGKLIVGITDEGGLALFDPGDNSCIVSFPFEDEMARYYDQGKNGHSLIILQDSNKTSRLIRYDGEHIETLARDLQIDGLNPGACEVTDIAQSRNGDIWVTTFSDVMVFEKGAKRNFDLKKDFDWGLSTSILELGNGNIWISGSRGIIQYDGENWSLIKSPEFETARKMIVSHDSTIWVISGTGIHRLINGTWVSNSDEEGLPNTTIFDILEDQQGQIWAATLKGAYCYFPAADTEAPETYIPYEKNFHEAIPSGELQFVFQGHDKWNKTKDDRLMYSYRFDENPWTTFGSTTNARSQGLSPGKHVFEVRAMDRNGNIDPSPAKWPFIVFYPWYLQTYFLILMAIVISIIFFAIRFAITRHRQVEKLVLIRTAELEKTKEKAEESDRLKSAFLANMSHEIRTPMNGILGFSELLKTPNLSGEKQSNYIGMIEKAGARMLSIINDIVSISKIESGQEEAHLKESNINEQIEYIYTFFKPEVDGKNMQLFYRNSLPSEESIIITDREKVFGVLTNLIKNAIKYSNNGSIEFGYDRQGEYLKFYVKDTGIGIPEDRQQIIFERFIQADIDDINAYEGAGLGLSISKAYVEMLGGKIWVESKEGSGSTFYFTLPYVPINRKITKEDESTSSVTNPTRKLKILIAEDEEISGEYINILVKNYATEIINVQNGLEAVEVCRKNSDIDLVLMDILMPVMNGYEAIKQIREFNKDVIIIAQTAYALDGDKEKALAAGCDDYIKKPINKTELLTKIENCISQQKKP